MKRLFLFMALAACTTPTINQEGTVSTGGTELYYRAVGKGEPVLIIHGGPVLDHSYMIDHFSILQNQYLLVFADQRYCGKSSLEAEEVTVTMRMLIDDIEALRNHLQLEKVHVLGHSWGGLLAARYAATYPAHVSTLILSNPMPPTTALWMKENELLALRDTEYDSVQRQSILQTEAFRSRQVQAVNALMKLSFKHQFYDTTVLDSLTINLPTDYFARSERFGKLGAELAQFDFLSELRKIKAPTLIVYGAHEPAAGFSGQAYREEIEGAELVVINACGHFPFVEQPDKYFGHLQTFLGQRRL